MRARGGHSGGWLLLWMVMGWKGGRTIRIEVATSYTVGTIEQRQFVSDRMDERVHNIIICIYNTQYTKG